MTPPVEAWHASELPLRVQITAKGARRKGMKQASLKECELLELLQYRCEVEEPKNEESLTICWPVERLFRRCQDRNGKFMVETTAWEGRSAGGKIDMESVSTLSMAETGGKFEEET